MRASRNRLGRLEHAHFAWWCHIVLYLWATTVCLLKHVVFQLFDLDNVDLENFEYEPVVWVLTRAPSTSPPPPNAVQQRVSGFFTVAFNAARLSDRTFRMNL